MTVLYVAGWMYSGSTLLGRVLGELDGAFAAGELGRVWSGFAHERPCGCGRLRAQCPVWSAVLADAYGSPDAADAARVDALARGFRLNRRVGTTLLALRGRGGAAADLREYRGHLARLHRSLARVTGAGVVVDTTKSPLYASILDGVDGVELKVVHLVRDPRGTLLSGAQRSHRRMGPVSSMALWTLSHGAIEAGRRRRGADRYRLVRYEDFARRPQETVASLARFAGLEPSSVGLDDGRVVLGESHAISGNERGRLHRGPLEIAPDEAWRDGLGPLARAGAVALTWPLLGRYGYRVRS